MNIRSLLPLLALGFATANTSTLRGMTVDVVLTPGFNLVANPLIAADNSIGALFKNMQGGVPGGTRVYKFLGDRFITVEWDDLDEKYVPETSAAQTTLPGDGVFVYLAGNANRTLTFIGESNPPGTCTQIPRGFSIKSHVYPIPLNFSNSRIPFGLGDAVLIYNRQLRAYNYYAWDDLDNNLFPVPSSLPPGSAFFMYRAGSAVTWCHGF